MNFQELHELVTKLKTENATRETAFIPIAPADLGAGITNPGTTAHGSQNGKDSLELPTQASHCRIYILGPMRGHDQYNFPAFYEMAVKLKNAGYDPVNPAELDRQDGFLVENLPAGHDFTTYPSGMDAEQVVRRDLTAIMSCGGYVALPGYEKSRGARAEKGVFDWRGAMRLEVNALGTGFVEIPNDTAPAQPAGGNPKDAFGLKKAPLRLVPGVALLYLSRAMGLGAKKYGAWNWRESKPRATVYYEAILRHLFAALDGQDNDEESGLPHLAHILANAAILLDAEATGNLIDDRAKSGKVAELLKKLTE